MKLLVSFVDAERRSAVSLSDVAERLLASPPYLVLFLYHFHHSSDEVVVLDESAVAKEAAA